MLNNLIYYFLYFVFLSFIGYVVEVIYCSIVDKKFENRGFFFGPQCPIYGFGALALLLLLKKYEDDLLVLFVMGTTITSTIEYVTSYALEKIFHAKWWDYSERKDNINGRICLFHCIMFGLGTILIIKYVSPFYDELFNKFDINSLYIISGIFLLLYIIDVIASLLVASNLRQRIIIAEDMKKEKFKGVTFIMEKKYKERIANLKYATNRLIKVFPDITLNISKELDIINKIKNKFLKQNKK